MKNNRMYHVMFERVIDIDTPENELPDIVRIQIDVLAENINQAMQRAWDILRTNPEKYEIYGVQAEEYCNNVSSYPRYR